LVSNLNQLGYASKFLIEMAKENYSIEKKIKNIPFAVKIFRLGYLIIDHLRLEKKLAVKRNGRTIFRFVDMGNITRMRANTFEIKEPETLSWIDSFEENALFLDVGANVGSYSLYAAKRGNPVIAIEPDPLNFALLNLNIYNNGLSDLVTPYPIALHSERKLSVFNLSNLAWGGASNSFDQPVDFNGNYYIPTHKSGVYGLPLDDFLDELALTPRHIKIDVDGNEGLILQGSEKTLSNPMLRSILIELSLGRPDYKNCTNLIEKHGFRLNQKTVSEMYKNTSSSGILNHIYVRS